MKLHFDSDRPGTDAVVALVKVQQAGRVDPNVYFDRCVQQASRSRRVGLDVHLVTDFGGAGTTHPHRPGTSYSEPDTWAATYDEWGWFLAELYRTHPELTCAAYRTREDFDRATDRRFELMSA
jgi:hypothetical protein